MIHDALRLARQYHNLKQTDLAERLGVSNSYLSDVEHGRKRVTLELLQNYSKALNIPLSHLMLFVESADDPRPVERARRAVAGKALAMLKWVEQITSDAA